MSSITDIYNALETTLATALPAYTKLPNAYDVEDNATIFLGKGYGLGIGGGSNTNRLLPSKVSISRDFEIVFVNQINATASNGDLIEAQEKEIFEDMFLFLKTVESDASLGCLAINSSYVSDSGLDFLDGETQRYFSLTMVVSVEYIQSLL